MRLELREYEDQNTEIILINNQNEELEIFPDYDKDTEAYAVELATFLDVSLARVIMTAIVTFERSSTEIMQYPAYKLKELK